MTPENTVDVFDAADYYDTRHSESLMHGTPEQAIEAFFDDVPTKDLVAAIAQHSPFEIIAYRRAEIPRGSMRTLSVDLMDHLVEELENGEVWCDEDGNVPGLYHTARQDLINGFEALVTRVFRDHDVHPWHCERSGRREYSREQVEAILRTSCPEWFLDGDSDEIRKGDNP